MFVILFYSFFPSFVFFQNYGAFFDLWGAGITGPVKLKGQDGTKDLSSDEWTYQVFLILL